MNDLDIGAYHLHEKLPGAYATYLGTDSDSGAEVVVKTVMGVFGTHEWETIAATLSQPPPEGEGVVPVIEIGLRKELVYAVAPFVDGVNLHQIIKAIGQDRSLLDTEDHVRVAAYVTARLAKAAADILAANPQAFRGQVMSSEQFIVTRQGIPLMLDPRWVALRTILGQPRSSSLVHSLAYQAPDTAGVDANHERSFVWGLATILWEMCTGYRLFRRLSLVETLQSLAERQVPEPSSLNYRVPYQLDALLMKVLSSPEKMSLADFSDDLVRIALMDKEGADQLTADWLEWLEPVHSVREHDERHSLSELEALLEDDEGVTWTYAEESTTYAEAPPSTRRPTESLSWLDDSTNTPTLVATDGVSQPKSQQSTSASEDAYPEPPPKSHSGLVESEAEDESRLLKLVTLASLLVFLLTLGIHVLILFAADGKEKWRSVQSLESNARNVTAPREVALEEAVVAKSTEQAPAVSSEEPHDADNMAAGPASEPSVLPSAAAEAPEESLRPASSQGSRQASRAMRALDAEPTKEVAGAMGDLAVVAPRDVRVYAGDQLLGSGNFRTTLREGAYQLRLVPETGAMSYLAATVRAGAMSVITIAE